MEDKFKKPYEDCDGCMSCGWKSGYWELEEFEPTGKVLEDESKEYWHVCTNQDYPDEASGHRGYYIYLTASSAKRE